VRESTLNLPNVTHRHLDENAYLDEGSILWLELKLASFGKIDAPRANEFLLQFPRYEKTLPLWYKSLVLAARIHVNNGGKFAKAPRPTGGEIWKARQQIIDELEVQPELAEDTWFTELLQNYNPDQLEEDQYDHQSEAELEA
jgi:hypothetical protein